MTALVLCLGYGTDPLDHERGAFGGRVRQALTLARGSWNFAAGFRYRNDRELSGARLARLALEGRDVDSTAYTASVLTGFSYGWTDDLTLSVSLQYSITRDFREFEIDAGVPVLEEADAVVGPADSVLSVTYRVFRGDSANLSLIGGLKLPTGSTRERTDEGERLAMDHQPGTGSVDPLAGVAVSWILDGAAVIDASLVYQITTEGRRDFEAGDGAVAGVAARVPLADGSAFPRLFLTGELSVEYLARDRFGGDSDDDSGGWKVRLEGGLRLQISRHTTFAFGAWVPVYQGVFGRQHLENFGLTFGISTDY